MDPARPRPRRLLAAVTTLTFAAGAILLTGNLPGAAFAREPAKDAVGSDRERALRRPAPESRAALAPEPALPPEPALRPGPTLAPEPTPRPAPAPQPVPAPELAPPPDPRDEPRAYAEHVLRGLPGGDEVGIVWDHPMIGDHLGGVRLDDPTVMMLSSRRFAEQPDRVASTVMHEIAHSYQGAAIAARADAAGGWWEAYWELDAALRLVFGDAWMELSADCVALSLGATWTHYTADCSAPGAATAVAALLDRSIP